MYIYIYLYLFIFFPHAPLCIANAKCWAKFRAPQYINELPVLPQQVFFYRKHVCPREVPYPNLRCPPSRETRAKTQLKQQVPLKMCDTATTAMSPLGTQAGQGKPDGALVVEILGGLSTQAFPHRETVNSSSLEALADACAHILPEVQALGVGCLTPHQPASYLGPFHPQMKGAELKASHSH